MLVVVVLLVSGAEVQQLRIKLHQEMSDIKNLLAAPHRVNSHTTRTETLGRFARYVCVFVDTLNAQHTPNLLLRGCCCLRRKTAQRIATMTVDRHRSKRWHGPCNTCRVKHAKYDTKISFLLKNKTLLACVCSDCAAVRATPILVPLCAPP